jgi:hypothetical protein
METADLPLRIKLFVVWKALQPACEEVLAMREEIEISAVVECR